MTDVAFLICSYQTLDVTEFLQSGKPNLVAVASAHRGDAGPQVLVQIEVTFMDSEDTDQLVGTDASWLWRNADPCVWWAFVHCCSSRRSVHSCAGVCFFKNSLTWLSLGFVAVERYYNPTPASGGAGLRESGVEFIDARKEVLGWNTNTVINASEAALWSNATVCAACSQDAGQSPLRPVMRAPMMAHPVQVLDVPEVPLVRLNIVDGACMHVHVSASRWSSRALDVRELIRQPQCLPVGAVCSARWIPSHVRCARGTHG